MSTATTHIQTEKRSAERCRCKLVPALRFKEFDVEWTTECFGKYVLQSAFGPRFSSDLYQKDGGIATLRTTDMDLDGNISYETMPFARITIAEVKDHILEQNDIVISRSGTIGITGIFKDFRAPVVPGAFLIRFRINTKSVSSDFIKQNFNSPLGRHKLNALSAGGVQKNLTGTSVKKAEVNFPNLPEQQKIASFLNSVDEKIQQLTKKKSLLEQYKKGVMQQLFSQKLRFKDEKGNPYPDWEEKRLGELCKLKNGYAFKSSSYVPEGEFSIVTIKNVQDGKMIYDFNTLNSLPVNLENHQLLQLDDILISMTGNVGRVCRVSLSNCVLNQRVGKITPKNIHKDYLYFVLNNKKFLISMGNIGQGAAQMNIGKRDILGYKCSHPSSLTEQQKIATYLSCIDTKIEAVNNQITQTQTFKKGLLQQMFV